MSNERQGIADNRIVLTTDNDNLDISSVVAGAEIDGSVKISVDNLRRASLLGANADVTTEAAVYTVPASTMAVVDRVIMTMESDAVNLVYWGHSVGGGALAAGDYIENRVVMVPYVTRTFEGPIYMAATDELRFDAEAGSTVSIHIYGRAFSV